MDQEGTKDLASEKRQIGCKVLLLTKIMTLVKEKAPANFVPAAAVIRRGLALFGMIGRKAFVGCIQSCL